MQVELIGGEESFLSEEYLVKVKSSYLSSTNKSSVVTVFADEIEDLGQIPQLNDNVGLFSSATLVVVRNLLSGGKAHLRDQFHDLIFEGEPQPETKLVLFERGKIDKRSKLYKKVKKSTKVHILKEFAEAKPHEKESFIKDRIWSAGWEIETELRRELVMLLQNQPLQAIASEIDKLTRLLGADKRKQMMREDLILVSTEIQEEIWEIFSLAFTNKKKAFELLDNLFIQQVNHIQIIGFLGSEIRKLIHYNHFQNKLSPFVRTKVARLSSRVSQRKLQFALDRLLGLDIKLKSTNMDPRLGLTIYLSIL